MWWINASTSQIFNINSISAKFCTNRQVLSYVGKSLGYWIDMFSLEIIKNQYSYPHHNNNELEKFKIIMIKKIKNNVMKKKGH